jgi:hypothetical protein
LSRGQQSRRTWLPSSALAPSPTISGRSSRRRWITTLRRRGASSRLGSSRSFERLSVRTHPGSRDAPETAGAARDPSTRPRRRRGSPASCRPAGPLWSCAQHGRHPRRNQQVLGSSPSAGSRSSRKQKSCREGLKGRPGTTSPGYGWATGRTSCIPLAGPATTGRSRSSHRASPARRKSEIRPRSEWLGPLPRVEGGQRSS